MNYKFVSIAFLSLALAFTGCQSSKSIDYSPSPAGIVSIPEKYSADQGYYVPGRHGEALWLSTNHGTPIEYPLLFKRKKVDEGTISIWIKPGRPKQYRNMTSNWLRISDGANDLCFSLSSSMVKSYIKKGPRYFGVRYFAERKAKNLKPLGGIKLAKNAHENFHQILFTWDRNGGEFYYDGKLIKKSDFVPATFDGGKTKACFIAGVLDDFLVLDRKITAVEVKKLHLSKNPPLVNPNTVLYVPFDGNLAGRADVQASGDLVRMFAHIGCVDATFRKDDPCEFDFYLLNFTSKKHNLRLSADVRNLKRSLVFQQELPLVLEPGQVAKIPFKMGKIAENGMFWGDFVLKDGQNQKMASERIPFAKTIAPDVTEYQAEEIPTGLVISKGHNPPCYEKWARFEWEKWCKLEYAPGKWDFEAMDMMVESAIRTGREPTLMFYGTPFFYLKEDDLGKGYYYDISKPPLDLERFKDYVRQIGERYKGKVKYYEVWNEPYWNDPSGGYFQGSAEKYAGMVNEAAKILHDIDPDNQVICGMGGAVSWREKVAKKTAGHADLYGVHPYGILSCGVEEFIKIKDMLKKHNASTRFAGTEVGNTQLQSAAIAEDGYPMTAAEFDKSGRWEKLPDSSYVKKRGRKGCVDPFTSSDNIVKMLVSSLASGCEHFLWWSSSGSGSVASLTCLRQTPSVPSVAYANAAGFLAAQKFVKQLDLGADYLKAYLFRGTRDGKYLIVAWSNGSPEKVNLEISDPQAKVFDIFANPYSCNRIGPVLQTELTKTPIYLNGFSSVPQKIKPVLKAVQIPKVGFPGSKGEILVSVYNPLNQNLAAELALIFPRSFKPAPSQKIDLKAKEERKCTFKFEVPEIMPNQRNLTVILNSTNPGIKTVRVEHLLKIKRSVNAKKAVKPILIDGNLTEWGKIDNFPLLIDKDSQVVYGTPASKVSHDANLKCDWKSTRDLSLKAKFLYDEKNLYLSVRVFDDKILNDNARTRPPKSYQGDCVELFLDTRSDEKQGMNVVDQNILQLLITPCLEEFPAPTYFVMIPKRKKLQGIVLASKLQNDGYTLELAIPWRNFPKINPKKLNYIGLDIAVDDQDKEKASRRKSQMMWSGDMNNHGDPSGYGVLKFK